jgi:protein-S-isoprenylcysteine O-methyltransferase Ste14
MPHWNLFGSVDAIRSTTINLWLFLIVVWLATSLRTKPTVQRQSGSSRFWQMVFTILGAFLIFNKSVEIAWLDARLLPPTIAVALAGLILTCLGVAFGIWARLTLGSNWSSSVTLKEGHTLICRGPYRLVRHPIYTGLLIALTGSAMQYGHLRHFVGVLAFGFGFWLKSQTEEQFMVQRFGDQYLSYRQHVRGLVPFVF